ncbi:MAG: hypothetical protein ACQ9MH_12495 [Nitrospinales bacterium]
MGKRHKTKPITIPKAILEGARLNLEGVQIGKRNLVVFEPAEEVYDFSKAWKSKPFQREFLKARDEAEPLPSDAPNKSELDQFQKQFLKKALGKKASKKTMDDLLEVACQEEAGELERRAGPALSVMRRTSVVRFEGQILILSTMTPAFPTIIAQASPVGVEATITADGLFTAVEVIWEILTGLLTLLGVPLRTRLPVGKWLNRIVEIIRRNRRLRRLVLRTLYGGKGKNVTSFDLLTLLYELFIYGFTWECVKEALDEIVDLTFWGIIRLLMKVQTRLTPGLGQALLLADLGLIVGEIAIKIYRHFSD